MIASPKAEQRNRIHRMLTNAAMGRLPALIAIAKLSDNAKIRIAAGSNRLTRIMWI
jgi:hypothetical protein